LRKANLPLFASYPFLPPHYTFPAPRLSEREDADLNAAAASMGQEENDVSIDEMMPKTQVGCFVVRVNISCLCPGAPFPQSSLPTTPHMQEDFEAFKEAIVQKVLKYDVSDFRAALVLSPNFFSSPHPARNPPFQSRCHRTLPCFWKPFFATAARVSCDARMTRPNDSHCICVPQ
jgi:hypothetical protein